MEWYISSQNLKTHMGIYHCWYTDQLQAGGYTSLYKGTGTRGSMGLWFNCKNKRKSQLCKQTIVSKFP